MFYRTGSLILAPVQLHGQSGEDLVAYPLNYSDSRRWFPLLANHACSRFR